MPSVIIKCPKSGAVDCTTLILMWHHYALGSSSEGLNEVNR